MNPIQFDTIGDAALWKRFREGNIHAFGQLYRRYYDVLFRYGAALAQDAQMAEDGIQECFLYLWTHRNGLAQITSVKFYLLKAYRRRLFEMMGRNRARAERELHYINGEPDFALPHEAFLIQFDASSRRRASLQRMLRDLTPRQREILHLKYYENLSYTKIADLLSINYQTAVNHVSEAMRTLRRSCHDLYTSA